MEGSNLHNYIEKEFNLKEERKKFVNIIIASNISPRTSEKIINMIQEQDDNFIKELTEKFRYAGLFTGICISEEINKLAGRIDMTSAKEVIKE